MLTRIRLENFKNWAELDLTLGNLTLLFGTNSSGKTSVLDALLLLKQTAISFDRYQPINLGGGKQDLVDLGSYRDLVFAHDDRQPIGVALEWSTDFPGRPPTIPLMQFGITQGARRASLDVTELSYSVQWKQVADHVIVERMRYETLSPDDIGFFLHLEWSHDNLYSFELPPEEVPPELERETGPSPIPLESCYVVPRTQFFYHRGLDFDPSNLNQEFELLVDRIAYLGPLRSHPQRAYFWKGVTPQGIGPGGEGTIEVLLASVRNQSGGNGRRRGPTPDLLKGVSEWLAKMGLVSTFEITPIDPEGRVYEMRVSTIEGGPESSSLVDVGFGVSQVLPIVTLLFFAPEGSIILLEQPELHLHPSAQAHLADLFLHVAETRGLQLIIESHSEHLLRRLQRRVAEAEHPLATPEHIKMYFCETKAEGAEARPVTVDEYGQIANWPENFFGDISGDLDALTDAAIRRRRQELLANE